ncbi:MAG: hypothetical protein JEZ11_02920 [Desulfobacterales bacterium]|nr:hypothetical protein [Desulfobacterales bacterium]
MKQTPLILLLLFCGCAANPACHMESMKMALDGVQVVIVGSAREIPKHQVLNGLGMPGRGCAMRRGVIYVLGRIGPEGTIEIDKEALGHEIAHILAWGNERVADPDGYQWGRPIKLIDGESTFRKPM